MPDHEGTFRADKAQLRRSRHHTRLCESASGGASIAHRFKVPPLAPLAIETLEAAMAQLMLRNLSPALVKALKRRAAKHNRSAEQEHSEILRAVLRGPRRRHLADVLAEIPNVGEGSHFDREQTDGRG
jgi:plasmid stability protein